VTADAARLRARFFQSAALGVAAWPVAFALLPHSSHRAIIGLVLLAPLVVVPLGLARIVPGQLGHRHTEWRALPWAQFIAALALCGAFTVSGGFAECLAVPWLGVTLWVTRLRVNRPTLADISETCRTAAVAYLPIGAAWAVCSRFGYRPLEFTDTIVLLTAAHFHYAGFAFPVIAAEIVRRDPSRLARTFALVAVGAVPVVAVGITTTQVGGPREIELASAWLLTAAGLVLGLVQLRIAITSRPLAGAFLGVSALSLMTALAWTVVYSGGQYGLWTGVDIPFMTHWHGVVNALGFALVGLVGWNLWRVEA
jgi:YndJ-like protein